MISKGLGKILSDQEHKIKSYHFKYTISDLNFCLVFINPSDSLLQYDQA